MFEGYSDGWVKLWRKIQEHEFYRERRIFSRYEAWIDMIQWANHQDNTFLIGNEVIKCERGSFVTSEMKLMNHWGWSKEKTRRFLTVCEQCEMIERKSDRRKTTITLINYNGYQKVETDNRPLSDHEETTDRPPADHERDTTKEVKNDKNVRKNILTDEAFLNSLKEKFTWIDFEQVMIKIDAWILAHPGRKKTRRFVVNWLNKIERPMDIQPNLPRYSGLKAWADEIMEDEHGGQGEKVVFGNDGNVE